MRKIPRAAIVSRDDWLVRTCTGKRVLHIGCTDDPITQMKVDNAELLHAKLARVTSEIVGLDIDGAGVAALRGVMPGYRFIEHNAEMLDSCAELGEERFDLVVAADVIEHIFNPGNFLSGVARRLAPGGRLVLTTPHSFAVKRMLAMFIYGQEFVHPDHVAYYSLATLDRLLACHGFAIDDFAMFQWRNPTARNRIANAVVYPLLWLTGGRLCDEIALTCSPRTA